MLRDIDNFKAALDGLQVEEAFMPVVAPASFVREAHNEYYPSEEAYVYAIADALKQEYQAIIDAGLLLQVDDAVLATMWAAMEDDGLDAYRRWAELCIEYVEPHLVGHSRGPRYHVCWGSWPGPHVTDIPLEQIVDLVLRVACRRLCARGGAIRVTPTSGRSGATPGCRMARFSFPD